MDLFSFILGAFRSTPLVEFGQLAALSTDVGTQMPSAAVCVCICQFPSEFCTNCALRNTYSNMCIHLTRKQHFHSVCCVHKSFAEQYSVFKVSGQAAALCFIHQLVVQLLY